MSAPAPGTVPEPVDRPVTTQEVRHPIAFRGPYADGPPPEDLRVDAPSLRRFGPAEVARAVTIAAVLAWGILRGVVRRIVGRRRQPWAVAVAEGLVDAFEILGPTFVKLGQMIASSPGVFPAPLADACLRCLDEVPPFSASEAREIVAEDLGRPVGRIFRSFEDRPLSAASIAQVHACVLADGREAVLKIQRPAIRTRMNRDLRIMYLFARLIGRTRQGRVANVTGVIEDLHRVTNEELNFALEADRQSRFRANIGAFGDNRWITAPEVHWDYCGPRVICMERMYGVPLDNFAELRRRNVNGELVLRRGVKVWMEAALVHGPFHGDVHAGNLWLLDDGRAAYLDFGIMGELPPEYREALADAQRTIMIDGDYTRIVRAWKRLGILPADLGADDEVAERIKMAMEPVFSMSIGQVSLGELMRQQLEMAEQLGAHSPRELVLVTKQLLYFERYAKELAPDYNMSRDLFLIKNVFPEEVARKCAAEGIELPDDRIPHADPAPGATLYGAG